MKNYDYLQPYILENLGREKMLLLNWKTRRNSLLTMLERFYELKEEIKMAMLQLDVPFDLSEKEMRCVKLLLPLRLLLMLLPARMQTCCYQKR